MPRRDHDPKRGAWPYGRLVGDDAERARKAAEERLILALMEYEAQNGVEGGLTRLAPLDGDEGGAES